MDHVARRPRQRLVVMSLLLLGCAALFPAAARAAGFGELILHSRIGENLLAEVPVLGAGKEISETSCYTLSARPGSDLPVVSSARLRLIHNKDNYRLLIVGNRPIAEPAFMISLRLNCGIDLQHDYILIPDAPASVGEIIENAAPAHGVRAADKDAAEQPARGKRQSASDAPRRSPRKANHQATRREAMPIAHDTGTSGLAAPPLAGQQGDRLVLGAAPLELKPGEVPAAKNSDEIEERLLKMETTLRSLNQEIEALNTALQLSTEMHSARRQLQLAESVQSPTLTASIATPVPPADGTTGNWLELLLSSLLGGSLSVGLAAHLGRQKQHGRVTL